MREVSRRVGLGIESVGGIDQGGAVSVRSGDGEELTEEEVAPATGGAAGEFGEGGGGESAVGGVVDGGYASGQPRAFPPGGGGIAFGDEVPKRSQFFGCSRQGEREFGLTTEGVGARVAR